MSISQNTADARLLVALQKGLPLDARPFARVGADLGLSEAAVLAQARSLFDTGVARRFGAVFAARSLGYESTLCAAEVPERELESAAARIAPHSGITHCYEREGHPNLWFTLTAPAAGLKPELARVSATLGRYGVLSLPALHTFKIDAVFGQREAARAPLPPAPAAPVAPLTAREREVVRRLQADLIVCEDPFGALAQELGFPCAELLALLTRWERDGVIRRIGLILRHRQLGLCANSMCVWRVDSDRIEAAGVSMARSPHVSHCYERPCFTDTPFNLYAMIHARTRAEAVALFERLGADAGLCDGRMLWSVREFKKSSPVFFGDPSPPCGRPGPA